MRYEDLEKLAIAGKLQVTKTLYRNKIRRRYVWDKEYEHIIETKKIPYKIFSYNARTEDMPENQFYKITKRDYEALLKITHPLTD